MTSIARLIAELAEVRVVSDRRADQLVSQAEMIGTLRAERDTARAQLDVLTATHAPVASNLTPVSSDPATDAMVPFLDGLRYPSPIALLLALVIVAGTLLLVWSW